MTHRCLFDFFRQHLSLPLCCGGCLCVWVLGRDRVLPHSRQHLPLSHFPCPFCILRASSVAWLASDPPSPCLVYIDGPPAQAGQPVGCPRALLNMTIVQDLSWSNSYHSLNTFLLSDRHKKSYWLFLYIPFPRPEIRHFFKSCS